MQRKVLKLTLCTLAISAASVSGLGAAFAPYATRSHLSVFPFKNWGLSNPRPNSSIDAPDAWTISEGSKKVVVAVVDTGIDPKHPSLRGNIWREPGNPSVYGWNFVSDQPNPFDVHGHGTHVAGIIGAINDPNDGMSGVAHKVSIMAVKYYADSNPGSVNLANTIKALNWAIDHGAMIINYSGGGPEFCEDEYLAMKKAQSKGILVVAAAGNDHQNTDLSQNYYYPAAYHLSNIISVAATDIDNDLLPSSNWGKKYVDVSAPGNNIYSTLPGGRFGYMTGTSQATAFVTGEAALLLGKDPSLTPEQIKEIVMASVDRFPQLENRLLTGGRVNAYSALLLLEHDKKQIEHDGVISGAASQRAELDSDSIAFPGTSLVKDLFAAAGF